MANREFRKRTSVVCVHQDRVLAFKAIDPTNHQPYVFLPGGKIEENETAEQAAIRETLEETGFEVELILGSQRIENYLFEWDGRTVDCHTYFYAARLKDPAQKPKSVNDASYHKGVCWIPLKECEQVFSYHPTIQRVVLDYLITSGAQSTDLR